MYRVFFNHMCVYIYAYTYVVVYMYICLFIWFGTRRELIQAELKFDWNFMVHTCSCELNKSVHRGRKKMFLNSFAGIQYQCRQSHLCIWHFVDLKHQHLGKRKDPKIFCFQISVVSHTSTVKLCTSVCGKPQNKMNGFSLCFPGRPEH